jgi:hypothetical protein
MHAICPMRIQFYVQYVTYCDSSAGEGDNSCILEDKKKEGDTDCINLWFAYLPGGTCRNFIVLDDENQLTERVV